MVLRTKEFIEFFEFIEFIEFVGLGERGTGTGEQEALRQAQGERRRVHRVHGVRRVC